MSNVKVLKTWKTEEELYEDFKDICRKERVQIGDKINGFIEQYLKEHKDGNPQFKLDQFADPNFVACPAFFRDFIYWNHYLSKQTPPELDKFKHQIIQIDKIMARYL